MPETQDPQYMLANHPETSPLVAETTEVGEDVPSHAYSRRGIFILMTLMFVVAVSVSGGSMVVSMHPENIQEKVTSPEASAATCPRQATKCDKSEKWKPGAWADDCPAGTVCHKTGCQPCEKGNHICDPDVKPGNPTCPNDKHCTPKGCEDGPDLNLKPWQACCGFKAAKEGTALKELQREIDALRDQVDFLGYKVDEKCQPLPSLPLDEKASLKIFSNDKWYDGEVSSTNPGTTTWKVTYYYDKQWDRNTPAGFFEESVSCFDVKIPSESGYKLTTRWATTEETNYPWDVTLKRGDALVWLCGRTLETDTGALGGVSTVTYLGMSDALPGNLKIAPLNNRAQSNFHLGSEEIQKIKENGVPPWCVEPMLDGKFRWLSKTQRKYVWRNAQ